MRQMRALAPSAALHKYTGLAIFSQVRCLPNPLLCEPARCEAPDDWVSRAGDELADAGERGPGHSRRHPDPMDECASSGVSGFLLIDKVPHNCSKPTLAPYAKAFFSLACSIICWRRRTNLALR